MSNAVYNIKTEEAAKKHGKASNQKCNFKYLMNSKTNRSFKCPMQFKENEIESILMTSAHKLARKTARMRPTFKQGQSVIIPLFPFEGNCSIRKQQHIDQNQYVSNHQKISADRLKFNTYSAQKDVSNCSVLQNQCKRIIKQFEVVQVETASMTEEFGLKRQKQIKSQLLQKEKDNIWNNVADIMKENMTLRQIVADSKIIAKCTHISERETLKKSVVQSFSQTYITFEELHKIEDENNKIKMELQQAKQFCLRIICSEGVYEPGRQFSLKNLISETINLSLMRLGEKYELEKVLLNKISLEESLKYKNIIDQYTKKMKLTHQNALQSQRMKNNMQKIYKKEIDDLCAMVQQRQSSLMDQIQRVSKEFKEVTENSQNQNKIYLDYVQTTNKGWNEKQRLYSTLLSESHKTIKSLMIQMKEFQSLAKSNYSLYLRSQRQQSGVSVNSC